MANQMHPSLNDYRGKYSDGWTPDDLEVGLRDLSKLLGAELICVWDGDNWDVFGGGSNIYVVENGMVDEIEDGGALLGFLIDGEGSADEVAKAFKNRHFTPPHECTFKSLRYDALFHRNFGWNRK